MTHLGWIGRLTASFQRKVDEWSRKRTEENAVARMERDKIRQVLLVGQPSKMEAVEEA